MSLNSAWAIWLAAIGFSSTWVIWLSVIVGAAVIGGVLLAGRRRGSATSPMEMYIEALDALLAGDETRARDLLRETVRLDSDNVPAYIRLGELFRKSGEVGRAIRIHREIAVRPRVRESVREIALQELALDYKAQGHWEKALNTLEDLRKVSSKSVFAHQAAAEILESNGDWDGAYEFRKQLQRLQGADIRPSLATFQAHVGIERVRLGDHKAARDHFKEAFRRDKHNLAANLYKGDLRYQQGKLEEAVELWRNVIRHHPGQAPWVYKRMEKAYFDLGEFESMVDVYDEVLKSRPDDARTLLAMAQLKHKKGDLEEVQRILARVMANDPHHRSARIYQGLIHTEVGNTQTAAELLADLLQDEMGGATKYACHRCSHQVDDMQWRCPNCGAWETMVEVEC